jgi:EAL domain-containing protein (putative c-di-GMP-specific phosphodiesterase class I)
MSPDDQSVRIPLRPVPFLIGRGLGVDLALHSPRISKRHCRIEHRAEGLVVSDLGSRNGTFLNGERISAPRLLREGDTLHIGHIELRYGLAVLDDGMSFDQQTQRNTGEQDVVRLYHATHDLSRVLDGAAVRAVFQPIVTLEASEVIGYEALCRHTLPSLSFGVAELLRVAHARGRAEELARVMRTATLADVRELPEEGSRVFMNLHPDEMREAVFLSELERSREALGPHRELVAEIHESAVADPATMLRMREQLHARGIELAYDDFGAGQSRLVELAEAPPDFLKIDMGLIRGIEGSTRRQDIVAALARVMKEAGIRVVAEGVETRAEHETCLRLGCELGQGFFYAVPAPVADLRNTQR